MRKNYDLDGSTVPGASLSNDIAFSRYMEIARSSEPPLSKEVNAHRIPTLLVEPNALLREGLKRILAETAYALVASAADLEEARQFWAPGSEPFLVIIDATRDHGETCRQIAQLKEDFASARVAMLVDHYDLKHVLEAFQAGTDAYLIKSVSCEVLVKSLDLVMLGETVFPSAVLDLVRERSIGAEDRDEDHCPEEVGDAEEKLPPKGLSVRETVILRCLMEGDSNKLIARKFDITEATVKVHVKAILRKIRAKNRTQAAIWAASHLPATGRVPTS